MATSKEARAAARQTQTAETVLAVHGYYHLTEGLDYDDALDMMQAHLTVDLTSALLQIAHRLHSIEGKLASIHGRIGAIHTQLRVAAGDTDAEKWGL